MTSEGALREETGARREETGARERRQLSLGLVLLGVALGGFFDGILLHQILQWHHLLSGLENGRFADLRVQVLADGLFHLLMYLLGLAGGVLVWRARAGWGATRWTLGLLLLGFALWHVADAVFSHWLLGLHRIRMTAEQPLLWDLAWLAIFGLLPLVIALLLLRGPQGAGPGSRQNGGGAGRKPALLFGLALLTGLWAAWPPPAGEETLVVFAPGVAPEAAFQAIAAAGGRPVWSDPHGGVWALAADPETKPRRLYQRGAVIVTSSSGALGCLSWIRA